MKQTLKFNDVLSVKDKVCNNAPLRGIIEISRRNKLTGETQFLHKGGNVITISGYQYILEKIFDLYMDSSHNNGYERLDKDTNLVIGDLNDGITPIGQPSSQYKTMMTNIAENHFIQGFMVGNGGAGEDTITSKNTNYSFVRLRNPIPFQMSQNTLSGTQSGKYIGVYRGNSGMRSYFIKKFDQTPHIYHSWWKDGQSWNAVDPVTSEDLGPNSSNPKTNRIETYAECILSIDDTDFKAFFDHNGNTQTAVINELGLVAFDINGGDRTEIANLYNTSINSLLYLIFDKNPDLIQRDAINTSIKTKASEIYNVLTSKQMLSGEQHISNFITTMGTIMESTIDVATESTLTSIRNSLSSVDNIGVQALYNQNDEIQYVTDNFMTYIDSDDIAYPTEDEAERIRLITYYTFNSIPVERNWELLINYRIYAN